MTDQQTPADPQAAPRRVVPRDVLYPLNAHPSRVREMAHALATNKEASDEVRYLAAMIVTLCTHIERVDQKAAAARSRRF